MMNQALTTMKSVAAFLVVCLLYAASVHGKTVLDEVSEMELTEALKDESRPCVFVAFYAPWSGHCRALEDVFVGMKNDLAKEKDKITVVQLNGDKYSSARRRFNVRRFPTVKMFVKRGGQIDEDGILFTGRYTRSALVHFAKTQCEAASTTPVPAKSSEKVGPYVLDISPYDLESKTGKNWLVGVYSNKDTEARSFAKEYTRVGMSFYKFRDVDVVKINADKYPEVRENFGISSTPTILWFEEGESQPDFYPVAHEVAAEEVTKWVHSKRGLEIGIDEMVFAVCDEHHMTAVDEIGSPYQYIQMFHSKFFGKALFIDGTLMTTERDESHYHEMLAHVPLAYIPQAKHALIMGGGDGGVLRQVLKHPNIETGTLVDIDEMVIKISEKHFKRLSPAFHDERSVLVYEDASQWVKDEIARGNEGKYDVIVIDRTTDNQGNQLVEHEYFKNSKKLLTPGGIMVMNEASCSWEARVLSMDLVDMHKFFKYAAVYQVWLPTYLSGHYCYFFLSDEVDPLTMKPDWDAFKEKDIHTDYYNRGIHEGAFNLPEFVKRMIKKAYTVDEEEKKDQPNEIKGVHVPVRGRNRSGRRVKPGEEGDDDVDDEEGES